MVHRIVVAFFIIGGVFFLKNSDAVCLFLNQLFQSFLTLIWSFRIMSNAFYACDTNRKILAVQKSKGEKGISRTVNVPYGYVKPPTIRTT